MASAGAIKAGEAYVRISLEKDELEKSLKVIQAKLNRFARTASQVGLAIGAFGTVGAAGLTKAVSAANEVELTGRRLDAVFREGADSARAFARTLAVEIGESRFALEKTLTTFKSFFAEIVDGEKLQTDFSEKLTKLSRDFAAFQGLSSDDALQRFISALSGSPEVLDRFGINLKASAINADLAARGIEGTTATVSEFQKVLSRIRIIESTLGSQGAIGKARQELATFAGAARAAKNAVIDLTVAIGQALLPVLRPIIATFANLAQGLTVLANNVPVLTVAVASLVAGSIILSGSLVAAGIAAAALALVIGAATSAFSSYQAFIVKAGLETAGFSAVLAAARLQLSGFVASATAASASAAGFGLSAAAATVGLTKLRAGVIATLATVGKLTAGFLVISTVLGSVPGLSTGTVVGLLAIAGAVFLLRQQFGVLKTRIVEANKFLKDYAKLTSVNLGDKGIIAKKSLSSASEFGIVVALLGRRFKLLTSAALLLKKAIIALAGPLGAVVASVAVVGLGAVALAKDFEFGERATRSWEKTLYTLEKRFPILGTAISSFSFEAQRGLDKAGNAFTKYVRLIEDGAETVKDGWAIITGGPTSSDKASAEARSEAEKTSDRLIELDRKIQDARIAGIQNTARRRRAILQAEIQREIQDEIAKNSDLTALRERQAEQLKQLPQGPDGREERIALKARQKVDLQKAIENNKEIKKIKQEGAIQTNNLEQSLEQQLFNERMEYAGKLTRARIEATQEGAAKELAIVIERQSREFKSARQSGKDLAALAEIQAQERANVVSSFNKKLFDEEASLQDEIAKEKLNSIQDAGKRQEAQLKAEFRQRMDDIKEARKALKDLQRANGGQFNEAAVRSLAEQEFNQKRLLEIKLSELRKQLRKEEEDEAKQAAEEKAKRLQSVQDDIESLNIDLSTPEGLDRTLAKIELERKRAVREAAGDDQLIAKINEKASLRSQLASQQEQVTKGKSVGSFDAIQIAAFGTAGSQGKSREQELLERQIQEAERQTRIQEEIRDGQGAR